jgi:hypothetical protein
MYALRSSVFSHFVMNKPSLLKKISFVRLCSGKTFVAKVLEEKFGLVRIEIKDMIASAIAAGETGRILSCHYFNLWILTLMLTSVSCYRKM